MKKHYLSLFLCATAISLSAQYSISGRIADEQKEGVPFANVLLLKLSDSVLVKGTVTDQNGNYLLADVSSGNFIIQSSMVGYEKTHSAKISPANNTIIQLQDIILKEFSKELDAVVVQAEKPLYEQTIDRMIVNVQSSPVMAGNSVLEILEKSPGIVVDRQNNGVTMNGKNGVNVMINGKLTRMEMTVLFGILEGMPSANIEKIELITTPPANFDAEGNAGFINIVLKKNDYEGLNGSLSATVGRNRKRQMSGGGNINYRKKKLNIFADYNYSDFSMQQYADINSEIQNQQYDFTSMGRSDRRITLTLSTGRIGLDYYISPKTIVGILGTATGRNWNQTSINYAYFTIDPGIDTVVTGIRTDQTLSEQYMANINFQHSFNDQQQLNIDFDYFTYHQDQPQTYSNEYFPENQSIVIFEDLRIGKRTPMKIMVGKLDYKIDISDQLQWEVGAKATLTQVENEVKTEKYASDIWQVDPLFSDFTLMDENIIAAYSSFSSKLSEKLNLKAGLRYEHTLTDIKDEQGQQVVYRYYGNFFPSVFLSRKLTENSSMNLAYSYRISRPTFSDLAPFVLFLGPKTFITGNTQLLPEMSHSLKTTYILKGVILSAEFNRILNSFARFQLSRIPNTDITLMSAVNLDQTTLYNISLALPVSVNNWWEMNNNLSGITSHITSNYFGEYMDVSNRRFTINTSQNFTLPKKYSLQLSGIYFSKSLSGIAISKPYGMISFAVRKEFEKNGGVLNLNFSDIFRTMIFERAVNVPQSNFYSGYRLDFDMQSIKLTYTNTFGNNNLKSRSKRQTGSAEDLKRVGN